MPSTRRCRTNKPVMNLESPDNMIEDLRFIRRTMEVSGPFTAVPGWGLVIVGVTALGAAFISQQQNTPEKWIQVWLGEGIVGLAAALWSMHSKATRTGVMLLGAPGRRFVLGLAPPLIAGAILTPIVYRLDPGQLPGIWLLLYGTAVVTGGAFSIRIVPVMGVCFMALGLAAFVTPNGWAFVWMLAGFAGLHIVFGYLIARKYGG